MARPNAVLASNTTLRVSSPPSPEASPLFQSRLGSAASRTKCEGNARSTISAPTKHQHQPNLPNPTPLVSQSRVLSDPDHDKGGQASGLLGLWVFGCPATACASLAHRVTARLVGPKTCPSPSPHTVGQSTTHMRALAVLGGHIVERPHRRSASQPRRGTDCLLEGTSGHHGHPSQKPSHQSPSFPPHLIGDLEGEP